MLVRIVFERIPARFEIKRHIAAVGSHHEIINGTRERHVVFGNLGDNTASAEIEISPLAQLLHVGKKRAVYPSLNLGRHFSPRAVRIKIFFEYVVHAVGQGWKNAARTLSAFVDL